MKVDLHCHTLYSDGEFMPREVVTMAKMQKLEAVAITDHDTLDGIAEGVEAGREQNILVIPGIEFSAFNGQEVHILGYGLNYLDEGLTKKVIDLQQKRKLRNEEMLEKLRQYGFNVSLSEIEIFASNTIGRTHIAKLLQKKGYVATPNEAFEKYISVGKPCYVSSYKLTCKEAIELICEYGGTAVLAHPFQLKLENNRFEAFIKELISYGLKGIEAFYYYHSSAEKEYFAKIANKYSLLKTVGSDMHGTERGIHLGELKAEFTERDLSKLLGK